MNIRQVEVFKAVMETGSVTAAAQRLGRSQPAISKHLGLLEEAIGVQLFTRTGNRLIPGAEAMRLFEQVELMWRGLDHLSRFAADLRRHQLDEVSVAAMPLLARAWLPDVLAPFIRSHETLSLSLPVRSSRWILETVATGQADIGVGLSMREYPGVVQQPLMTLPLVCVLRADHVLAGKTSIAPEDLDEQLLIGLSNFDHWRLAVEQVLEQDSVRPARRIDSFTTYVACELAARVRGVAIVDALTARDYAGGDLTWRPFTADLAFQIQLMQPRERRAPRLTDALVAELLAAATQTVDTLDRWMREPA